VDLTGKNVIITGGTKGIGRAIAGAMLDEGANIAVFDIDTAGLDDFKNNHPDAYGYECDLTDPDQVEKSVDELYKEFGRIDVLVNNAGLLYNSPLIRFAPGGIQKHNYKMWDKVLRTNLSSVFYTTTNVAEKMILKRTKGVIANISSVCASGNRGQSAYSASKAGVNALTATWAKELGMMGIRVVGIAPGYTDTISTHDVMNEEALKEIKKDVPLRRLGTADEISAGVLAVIKNDFFNGKVFELDGGLIL
jgi:3-oxoacyl-[acyl-carrier protein] reductase